MGMFNGGFTVRLPVLIGAFVIGTGLLLAIGWLLPAGPVTVTLGSIVGLAYAGLATKWFLGLPEDKRRRLNPKAVWTDKTKRTVYLSVIVVVWAAIAIASFNFAPVQAHPAIGALNVVFMWAVAAYFLGPGSVPLAEDALPTGQDASMFDWVGYLFTDKAVQAAAGPEHSIVEGGRVNAREIPLSDMQRAWEEEQEYLQEYRDSGGR